MSAFRSILAGIDLAHGRLLPAQELDAVGQEISRCAAWLAGKTGARLTFFTSLDLSAKALQQPVEDGRTFAEAAREALDALVRRAQEAGIDAHDVLALGHDHLLDQVRQGGHDLFLIGTHEPHGIRRLLFGDVARQLLHACPCPVWVVRPQPRPNVPLRQILVASRLGPLGQHKLDLAVALAHDTGAQVHVLHVIDYPIDHIWADVDHDKATTAYHQRMRAEAEQALRQQLEQAGVAARGVDVKIHLLDKTGLPEDDIRRFLKDHAIDLLVLGMEAHTGLEGFLLGNAAERILPELPCSLLAVRPDDVSK